MRFRYPTRCPVAPVDTQRALKRLLKRRLLEEHPAKLEDSLWRKDRDDRHLTLRITSAGFKAINLEVPEDLRPTTALSERMTKTERRKTEWKTTAKAKPKSESKPTKAKTAAKTRLRRQRPRSRVRRRKLCSAFSSKPMEQSPGHDQGDRLAGSLGQRISLRRREEEIRLSLLASEDGSGVRRYRLKSRGKS